MTGDDDEMPGMPQYNAPTDSETDDDAMNESGTEASASDSSLCQGINGVDRAT